MDIINNRYRVIKKIKEYTCYISYLVCELTNEKELLSLNLIKSKNVTPNFIQFYINNICALKRINTRNIISIKDFGLVENIDGRRIENKQRYYIYKYSKDISDFKILERFSQKEKLDMFIELCKSINYIHMKGIDYGKICFSNLNVRCEENKYKLMLEDIITATLNQYDLLYKDELEIFNTNRFGQNISYKKDIYNLGILLISIINGTMDISLINKIILNKNNPSSFSGDNTYFYTKLNDIALKMISDNSYASVTEVIEDINKVFHTKYSTFRIEEIERLNFDIDLIGRKRELDLIFRNYNEFKNGNSHKRICTIYGEEGIGKSKFLEYFKRYSKEQGEEVFDIIYSLKTGKVKNFSSFIVILKKIITVCPAHILNKYSYILNEISLGLDNDEIMNRKDAAGMRKLSLRFINRIGAFISEYCKYKSIIIIIDDMHDVDDLTLDIIKYLWSLNSNIFFLMSYGYDRNIINLEFEKWINESHVKENIINVHLKGIEEEKISEIIKQILLIPEIPEKMDSIINERAKGNPLFIQEVIKELFIRKIIYVDDNGKWVLKNKSKDLIIPKDMETALIGQLNGINLEERYVLEFLSIFKNSVSNTVIESLSDKIFTGSNHQYFSLERKRFINIVYNERGYKIYFYNRFLKSIIRDSMSKNDILKFSNKVATQIEILFNNGHVELLDELIYQLEVINNTEKLIIYYIKNSLIMIERKNKQKALKYLKKALSFYENNDKTDKNKIDIYYNMGLIYLEDGRLQLSEKMFNKAIEICLKLHEEGYNLKILNSLVEVYIGKQDTYKLKYVLDKIESLVKVCDNEEYLLQFHYIRALYESFNYNYSAVIDICEEALSKSKEGFQQVKASMYNTIGFAYIELGKTDKAMENLKKSIECAEKFNNPKVLYKAYNNFGVIYGDFYQDYEKAISYIKMAKEVADKNNLFIYLIRTKNNLGAIYLSNYEYEASIRELKEIEQLIPNYDIYEYVYTNVIMCRAYITTEDVLNALKSYNLIKEYHDRNLEDERCRSIIENFLSMIQFNVWFGKNERAMYYIKRFEKLKIKDKSLLNTYINIYKEIVNIMSCKNVKRSLNSIISYMKEFTDKKDLIDILITIVKVLIYIEKIDLLHDFLSKYEHELNDISLKPIQKAKSEYIKSFLKEDLNEKEEILKNTIRLCRNNNLKETYFMAFVQLYEVYREQEKKDEAEICYLIAFKSLKELMRNVPKEYILNYIAGYKLNKVFNDLPKICELFYNMKENNKSLTLYDLLQIEDNKLDLYLNKNKKVIKICKDIYNYFPNMNLEKIINILEILDGDDYENLSILNKYLTYNFIANRTLIIANQEDGFEVLHSSNGNKKIDEKEEELIHKVRNIRNTIKEYDDENNIRICIPILTNNNDMTNQTFLDRRAHIDTSDVLLGYIYVECNCIFEGYINSNIKNSNKVNKLIGIFIDKINLKNSAFYDKLTGALTRKYLDKMLKETLENSRIRKESFCILMLDFDRFKRINDKYGHQVGDKVLKEASHTIKSNIRNTDILGRYGGEELVVILPNIHKNIGVKVGEKLRRAIEKSDMLDNKEIVTVSIGVVCYPEDGRTILELLERSDKALYVAKNRGRNRVVAWENEFKDDTKGSNHLSGTIIKGFMKEDKYFFTMIEIVQMIKEAKDINDKLESVFAKIVDITKSDLGYLFLLKDNKIICTCKQVNENVDKKGLKYNKDVLKKVIKSKTGLFTIDWDNLEQIDAITNLPDWKSIIVTPIIFSDEVVAVIYLSVSTKSKEFTYEDFNIVNLLGSMATPIFLGAMHSKN